LNKIILIGAGGHCKSVIDVIEQEGKFKIHGIVDKPKLVGTKVLGYPVIGSDIDLKSLAKKYKYALVAVGQIKSAFSRIKLFKLGKSAGFYFPSIKSPRAYVSKYAKIGSGTVIMHDAIVNANSIVMENCIINNNAIVSHGSIIEDHVHLTPGSIIAGNCHIGEFTTIGMASTVFFSTKIGKNCLTHNNSSVLINLDDNSEINNNGKVFLRK